MKLHQKFLILILICIIIFPLIELKSNAGLPPHYSGYIDIELKNYNNNDIKINSIDNKDMNLFLSDNKIKTDTSSTISNNKIIINKSSTTRIEYFLYENINIKPILNISITNNDGTITEITYDGSSYYSEFGNDNPYYTFTNYDCNTGKYKENKYKTIITNFQNSSFEDKLFKIVVAILLILLISKIIYSLVQKNKHKA